MPATATPRKPQTLARKLVETRNTSRNRGLAAMLGLGDSEKELARDFGSGLNDVIGRGTLASLIGLPGDLGGLAENGIRSALGMPQVQPYGGSEHIGQKLEEAGLVSPVRRPKTELLASLISPSQAASAAYRAPQMARAGVRMLDNLAAPRTMGSQTGAIENLWHASPHEFDKFSLGKAGEGDGASVFGHGAYLSESPEISGHGGHYYKQFMSDAGKANAYEVRLAWPDKAMEARTPLTPENFLKWDRPLSEQGEQVRGLIKENMPSDNDGYIAKLMQDAENDFYENGPGSYPSDRFEAALDEAIKSGNYGERFGADVWDELKEAAPNIDWKGVKARLSTSGAESSTGGGIYDDLVAELGGREAASRRLLEIGIPGIRYPETMSIGNGAHNYVVFDDRLIDIVSRNGQPVGNLGKMVAPQDEALRVAQQNAAKPIDEGGLGLRPDNTPEERAAAMGFDIPVYHATDQNFTAFDPLKRGTTSDSGWYGDADYTAPSPDYAARFIEKPIDGFVSGVAYKDGGNIMPLLARAENPYDWRANEPMGRGLFQNDRRASIDKRKELQGMGHDSVAVNNSKIFLDDGQELSNEQWDILTSASPMLKSIGKQEVENLIRANNYDFRDFARSYGIDAASAMPQRSDMVELATFNPSQLRSRFAAFDPMRRDSSDILAGLAPLGLGAWMYQDEPVK